MKPVLILLENNDGENNQSESGNIENLKKNFYYPHFIKEQIVIFDQKILLIPFQSENAI